MLGALSAIGSIFSFLGAALKGLFTFVVYRQGEKAQAQKDQAASLKDATDARKIDDAVSGLSDGQLDDKLRRPAPGP
jgi:hypothetical protein